MGLVVGPGREDQCLGRADGAVAEPEPPEAVDLNRPVVVASQLSAVVAGSGIVCVDTTIAEVADQKVAAVLAEGRRRDGQSPRRVELVGVVEAAEQMAAGVEHVDKAVAATGDVVLALSVLLGVGDVEPTVQRLNIEWSEALRNPCVPEAAGGVYRMEVAVPCVDRAGVEVGAVEQCAVAGISQGQSLVDGAR